MNETIKIDGKEYEVLPLDDPRGIGPTPTHARLAGGKVVDVAYDDARDDWYCLWSRSIFYPDWEDLGIQPLKLIERKPVEFVADFAKSGSVWYPLHHLSDGLAHQNSEVMKFRCVQITEEA